MTRSISEIAWEIKRDWKQPNYAAVPYLQAMMSLDMVSDSYGADSAKSVLLYFLSNAGTWRGPVARRVKAELITMTRGK